jgi:hypothetical protein
LPGFGGISSLRTEVPYNINARGLLREKRKSDR